MTEQTTLERAARALAKNMTLTDQNWPQFIGAAHAVLRAIREPSEAMKKAAAYGPLSTSLGGENTFDFIGSDDAKVAWESMIDTALAEGPPAQGGLIMPAAGIDGEMTVSAE